MLHRYKLVMYSVALLTKMLILLCVEILEY